MAKTKKAQTAKKSSGRANGNGIVEFNFANISYQVDPGRRKVYHRWVEVETAKTCMIMSAFQQSHGFDKRAM